MLIAFLLYEFAQIISFFLKLILTIAFTYIGAGKFRVAMTAFGTGFGAGDAFRLANQEFEKELKK